MLDVLRGGDFEYVILFESSGMYRGEDIAGLNVLSLRTLHL